MTTSIAIAQELTTFRQVEEKLGKTVRHFRHISDAIAISQQFIYSSRNPETLGRISD